MVEPLGETVPALFDRGEFRSVRGKVPDVEIVLIVPVHARDRTVGDSFGRALITDVLPEISVVEVPSTGEEHHQRLTEPLLERPEQPATLVRGEIRFIRSCVTMYRR